MKFIEGQDSPYRKAREAMKLAANDVGMEVLDRLYRANENGLSLTEICRKSGKTLSNSSVRRVLKRLDDLGMVYVEISGRNKIYHLTERGRKFYEILKKLDDVR